MVSLSNYLIIFAARWLIYLSLGALFYLWLKGKRRDLVRIVASVLIAVVFEKGLDLLFHIPRPFVAGGFNPLVSVPLSEYYSSFPSGHATFMSALGMAVFFSEKRAGVVVFILAILTGIGRVAAGVHYPIDILGGFLVGVVTAGLVMRADRPLKKLRKRPVSS